MGRLNISSECGQDIIFKCPISDYDHSLYIEKKQNQFYRLMFKAASQPPGQAIQALLNLGVVGGRLDNSTLPCLFALNAATATAPIVFGKRWIALFYSLAELAERQCFGFAAPAIFQHRHPRNAASGQFFDGFLFFIFPLHERWTINIVEMNEMSNTSRNTSLSAV